MRAPEARGRRRWGVGGAWYRRLVAVVGEGLIGHHLRHAADHPLANAGDQPTHLYVGAVGDARAAVGLGERDHRVGLDEARAATALGREAVRLGRLLVRRTHLAPEGSLPRPHADLQRRLVFVVPDRLELFAAGDRLA